MSIFVGDTAPSKIFVGDTEVSKVFVGDVKVRPTITPRTPDATRTVFYYDFEDSNNRLKDTSGNNRNLSSATAMTYTTVGGQTVAQATGMPSGFAFPGSYGNGIGTGNFTMSCRIYPLASTGSNYQMLFALAYDTAVANRAIIWSDTRNLLGGGDYIKYQFGEDAYKHGSISASSLVNGWHHFVVTRISGNIYCYIDKVLNLTLNNYGFTVASSGNGCALGRPSYNVQSVPSGTKGDKFILEKVGWSSQDVTNYYDSTKSIYGIS